ncbi:MAG: hypothetical protein K2X82_31890 [Gemmataceae bacterium]|nr:hypothetical protein [Gemmataceae bacterium]
MSGKRKPFRGPRGPVTYVNGGVVEGVNELPIDPSIGTVEFIDYSKLPPDGPEYLRQQELAAAFEAGRRAGLAEAAAAAAAPPPTPPADGA